MSRSKLKTLVLINWRGVFYQPFDMDKFVTSLTGLNGAGKTTVMAGVYVSLLPDKTLIDLRSQAGKGVSSKKQGLYGKFGPGNVSYSVIELVTSSGERVIGGVQIRKKAAPEFELIPFIIEKVNPDVKIEELFLLRDGKTDTIVDSSNSSGMNELSAIVKSHGGTTRSFKSRVGEYMSSLYELGLMPMRLNKVGERKKFNKLLQTSLFGGLSGEIQQSLKDYLLDKDTTLSSQISRAESNLATCKQTREAIERTEQNRILIENVYKSATEMASSVMADLGSKYKISRDAAIEARQAVKKDSKNLKDLDSKKISIDEQIEESLELISSCEEKIEVTSEQIKSLEKAETLKSSISDKADLVANQESIIETTAADISISTTKFEELKKQKDNLSAQVDLIVKQLVDANETFNIETKKASLYKAACSAKEKYQELFPTDSNDGDQALNTKNELELRKTELVDEAYHLKNQLEEFSQAKTRHTKAFSLLENVVNSAQGILKEPLKAENAFESSEKVIGSLRNVEDMLRDIDFIRRELGQTKVQIQNLGHVKSVADPIGIANGSEFIEKIELLDDQTDALKSQISNLEQDLFDIEDDIKEKELQLKQAQANSKKKEKANEIKDLIENALSKKIDSEKDIDELLDFVKEKKESLIARKYESSSERKALSTKVSDLQNLKTFEDDRLVEIAGELGGDLMSDLLDHLDLEQAALMEAKLGPLKHAISVEKPTEALEEIRKSGKLPDELYIVNRADLEQNLKVEEANGRIIVSDDRSIRVSKIPSNPILGADARDRETERLERKISKISESLISIEIEYDELSTTEKRLVEISQSTDALFSNGITGSESLLNSEIDELSEQLEETSESIESLQEEYDQASEELTSLKKLEHLCHLLDEDNLSEKAEQLEVKLKKLTNYQAKYGKLIEMIPSLTDSQKYLRFKSEYSKEQISELLEIKENEKRSISATIQIISDYVDLKDYLRYEKSETRLNSDTSLTDDLNKEKSEISEELKEIEAFASEAETKLITLKSKQDSAHQLKETYSAELASLKVELDNLDIEDQSISFEQASVEIDNLKEQKSLAQNKLDTLRSSIASISADISHGEKSFTKSYSAYKHIRQKDWAPNKENFMKLKALIKGNPIFSSLEKRVTELESENSRVLSSIGSKSLAELKNALIAQSGGVSSLISELVNSIEMLLSEPFGTHPAKCISLFEHIHAFMEQQLPRDIVDADNPLEALAKLSTHIQKLRLKLKHHENDFSTSSHDVAYGIEQKIRKEFRNISRLNDGLDKVRFGNIRAIRVKFQKKPGMDSILQALLNKGNESPLFSQDSNVSFEEALQKLYETHIGKKFTGDSLLDFRHYIELQVQIKRASNSETWENADSNRLSTGESIGVGLSILIMVLQSWETNTMRITGKRHESLRFLFLDEASRLDISSINTLASLCANMGLQLLIAAPSADEAIAGTTYCLNRVVDTKGKEKVIVRGLRGFKRDNLIEFGDNAYEVKLKTTQKSLEFTPNSTSPEVSANP